MTLPVTPSLIDQQEKKLVLPQFTHIEGMNSNPELMFILLTNIYKITPQFRVIDT